MDSEKQIEVQKAVLKSELRILNVDGEIIMVPCHIDDETARELYEDPKEKMLIRNRLRHKLNADCLAEIFSYLNVRQLVELSEMSDFFKNIVAEQVIGKKSIHLTVEAPWASSMLWVEFGKRVRKLHIMPGYVHCLEESLQWIIRNCKIGMLNDLTVYHLGCHFGDYWRCNGKILQESMAFFTHLNKLTVICKGICVNDDSDVIMKKIGETATELHDLKLDGWFPYFRWSSFFAMKNITELRISDKTSRIMFFDLENIFKGFESFLRSNPKLKIFNIKTETDVAPIVKTLAEYCPDLQCFKNLCSRKRYSSTREQLKFAYEGIQNMNCLRELTVTSFTYCGSDLQETFLRLPNSLKTLGIYITNPINGYYYCSSSGLGKVETIILQFGVFPQASPRTSFGEYLLESIGKSINIKTVRVESKFAWDLHKILESAPHIKTFDIARCEENIDISAIYETIRNNRQLTNEEGPLIHLVLNKRQWKDAQSYEDFTSFATFEIPSTIDPLPF